MCKMVVYELFMHIQTLITDMSITLIPKSIFSPFYLKISGTFGGYGYHQHCFLRTQALVAVLVISIIYILLLKDIFLYSLLGNLDIFTKSATSPENIHVGTNAWSCNLLRPTNYQGYQ